jgi:subtilisin family serine protease
MKGETAMENKRRWRNLIILGLILILLLVLALCRAPGAPSPNPTTEIEPPPELKTDSTTFKCDDLVPISEEPQTASIKDQLLLRGPSGNLEQIAAEFDLTLIRLCHLDYIQDNLVMGLYTVQTGDDPQTLSDEINRKYNEAGVTASPNYLIGPSVGSCVDPYSDGGSLGGTLGTTATRLMFFDQWAPKKIGLAPIKPWTAWSDVQVAVFDTMPNSIRPSGLGISNAASQTAKQIRWTSGTGNASLFFLKTYDVIGNVEFNANNDKEPPLNFDNHGFFVAGLIRLIAPNSEIHLIRALGANGCGSTQTLTEAIDAFMDLMVVNGKRKVVINLSLGAPNLPQPDVPVLAAALQDAKNRGAVIVAAAGNDSADLPAGTLPVVAQAPARFNMVIGVVASNKTNRRSCYSNRAVPVPANPTPNPITRDVAAPGGDGGQNADETEDCVARTKTFNKTPTPCPNIPNCGYGVVSLINPVKVNPSNPNSQLTVSYGFWSGSSFSTPLVSGLAALLYEKPATTQPNRVYCAIAKGAKPPSGMPAPHLGAGVINVPRSLTLTPSACP